MLACMHACVRWHVMMQADRLHITTYGSDALFTCTFSSLGEGVKLKAIWSYSTAHQQPHQPCMGAAIATERTRQIVG